MNNQGKVVEIVIAKGANWNTLTNHPPSTQFKTPLQLAGTAGLTVVVKILEIGNKRKKKKEYQKRKKEEAKLLKEIEMSEEEIAVEKRLVEADEEEEIGEDEEDGKTNEIEDQIEEMNLLPPPPAPVQDICCY